MSKKKQELTPWFEPEVKPVREGIYQRDFGDSGREEDLVYSKFSGGEWWTFGDTVAEAASERRRPGGIDWAPWRGLAKKP